jgi:hypothetical protein
MLLQEGGQNVVGALDQLKSSVFMMPDQQQVVAYFEYYFNQF